MKSVWLAVALAPLSFAAMTVAAPARADTTISSNTSTPLKTSTSGNIAIQTGGAINVTASGAVVTIDSNNTVTNNGTISSSNVSDSQGIFVSTAGGPITGSIKNAGQISISEKTSGDSTNVFLTTGPFANGANRFGIEITGPGVFNGSVTNTGNITVVGENSADIFIGSQLNGNLTLVGSSMSIMGGTPTYSGSAVSNSGNVSYGINATGLITGTVTVGSIAATGQNAVGAAFTGGVTGTGSLTAGIDFEGTITATGYRSTFAPTDPAQLAKLNPDQMLQGGPAAEIAGAVPGGILVTQATAGIGNIAGNPEGVLNVFGAAPAMLIGGANATTIGPNTDHFSLEIQGQVNGNGSYPDVSSTGIQVGGVNPLAVASAGTAAGASFAPVSLANGITVSGAVTSWSKEHTSGAADSTALLIGSGATVGGAANTTGLIVTGQVVASSISDARVPAVGQPGVAEASIYSGVQVPISATAVKVQTGGSLTTIRNSGVIAAAINGIPVANNFNAAGGVQGQAIAIDDESGTVSQVTNTGTIVARVNPIISSQSVDPAHTVTVAAYLANTGNAVTVLQSANANASLTPTMVGDIVFGNVAQIGSITGAETLDIEAGVIGGNVVFNGGGINTLTINNGASLSGGLVEADAGGSLAINVANGTLNMTRSTATTPGGSPASINVSTLTVGSKGEVVFTVDPSKPNLANGQFNVAGTATLDANATIGIGLASKLLPSQNPTFTLIHAGSLVTGDINGGLLDQLPFVYSATLTVTPTDLDVTIGQKSAAALGMNPAQAAAYNAIYDRMSKDTAVEVAVLAQTDRAGFFHIYNQFLPDYEGGVFETLASAQRVLGAAEADPPNKLLTDETRGWVQEIGVMNNREDSDVANGYRGQGLGLAGGIERSHGNSSIGVAGALMTTGVRDLTQPGDSSLSAVVIEGGVYYRKGGNGLNVSASVNGGYVSLGSHRLMINQTSTGAVTLLREAESRWGGGIVSGQASVGYQMTMGRFYAKPEASVDYIALFETGHSERNGGDAFNLAVSGRTSSEASVQGDIVMGYTFGTAMQYRPQVTVGYRQVITGGPGATTAKFVSGGPTFVLNPDLSDRGGLLARLGLRASGLYADITADAGGEFRNGYQSYDARAVARFLF